MNLSGNWQGFYEYGSGYELPYFGQRVLIKASITDINGCFTGKIEEDDSVFSTKLNATIKGFVEDGFISFIKQYQKYPIISDDYSSIITYEDKTLEIEYEGILDENNNSIYGNWYIMTVKNDEIASQGIWLLTKL
jgi:hypothetical protein